LRHISLRSQETGEPSVVTIAGPAVGRVVAIWHQVNCCVGVA
jgi:hypothetical protein